MEKGFLDSQCVSGINGAAVVILTGLSKLKGTCYFSFGDYGIEISSQTI